MKTFHFAIFDKPKWFDGSSFISSINIYTLLDEIRYLYLKKVHLVHRIDTETSGLVLVVSEMLFSDMVLKKYVWRKRNI